MATYKLGKLKFNISKAGLAFRWGDGEIRRFPFGLGSARQDDVADGLDQYDEAYDGAAQDQDYDYAADDDPQGGYDGYDDGYTDDDSYAYDDGYEDSGSYDSASYGDGGYDDGSYDDANSYDDGGYDDNGYDDSGYDDGGYDDSGYDDNSYDDSGYDDGYDDGYDEDGYYDEDGNYVEAEGGEAPSFMQYIDENDWVTYVLLVLFPPLGIYLLWRRGRFDMVMRVGISVASALWFAVLIYLIVSLVTPAGPETTFPAGGPTISPVTVAPSATVGITVSPSATTGIISSSISPTVSDELQIEPSATPIAGSGDSTTASDYVYASNTGIYYHSRSNCERLSGETASLVSLEIAERRGLDPCPTCYDNQTTYYMTDGGMYYHTNSTCDGGTGTPMVGAYEVTLQRAQNSGKTACPVCAGGTARQSNTTSSTMTDPAAVTNYANTLTTDRSGLMVYARLDGTYFHTDPNCSGMTNASHISLLVALQNGKAACPTCCAVGRRTVYCTENGEWFHIDPTCQGMRNANQTYVALALAMGKTACPVCLDGVTVTLNDSGTGSSDSSSSSSGSESDGTVYVYATRGGEYYHTDPTCNGMQNAERVALSTMLEAGRPACPDCCPTANNTVWASRGGTYYHSYATCSGMTGATTGTVAEALAAGFQKCPYCWTDSSTGENSEGDTTQSVSGITVYCTDTGTWYHNDQYCQGMRSAYAVTLEEAVSRGKTACPVCCSIADRTVYAVNGGRYYHYDNTCNVEDLSRATSGTLARALMAGFARCPSCVSGSSSGDTTETVTETYTPGTSGIHVYATRDGQYYHLSSTCAGSEASYITLETALNYGKTACPICARSTAERTVWSSRGDEYFHIYREHAGDGATSGTLAVAHAMGKEYCPVCLARYQGDDSSENMPTSSNTYVSGTSGLYVYATLNGTYFHIDESCTENVGSDSSRVTLETALNYGKVPCRTCANVARTTVYSSSGDRYYHYSQSHAGSGSTSGYLAIARAMGKTACPVCVNGSSGGNNGGSGGNNGGSGGSGGSGNGDLSNATQVYIDLQGDSDSTIFHSHSTCSRAGMTNGSMVVIDFVRDQGFSPCPYCWN